MREATFSGSPRKQAQIAWSSAPAKWALLNASPDLRAQIEATPELWPSELRDSPIREVILPSAEADAVLGLLLLREFHKFRVHATASVRRILTEDNSLFGVLARFPGQVCWDDIRIGEKFIAAGARIEAVALPGTFPGFIAASRVLEFNPADAVLGFFISPERQESSTGRTMAVFLGVSEISGELRERLESCDILLFDGTFWSNDEPLRIPGITRTARQMGHLPISGPGGSLELLAKCRRPRKLFIHINNTNPILDEASVEHRMVRDGGWEVASDGMELTL